MDAKKTYTLDIANKSRKYDIRTVVGTIKLIVIKLNSSFSIYLKVFVCTVGVSI